jgi:glutaredoxin 2
MDLSRFNADDIHELRVQMAEEWRNMSKEDAERDFKEHAENTRRAIEEIRRKNALKAG